MSGDKMEIKNYYLRQGLRVFFWLGFLFVYLFASGTLEVVGYYLKDQGLSHHILGLSLIILAGALSLVAWRYGRQLQINNPRRFGRVKLTARRAAQFALIFVLLIAFQMLWSFLIAHHILATPNNQKAVEADQAVLPIWNAFFSVVLAPIFEELIFRGIFMNYFFNRDNRLNNFLAVVVSGFVFGYAHELHFDVTWVMYSVLGCFLAYSYMHFRDIRYSIGLHFLNNFLSFI